MVCLAPLPCPWARFSPHVLRSERTMAVRFALCHPGPDERGFWDGGGDTGQAWIEQCVSADSRLKQWCCAAKHGRQGWAEEGGACGLGRRRSSELQVRAGRSSEQLERHQLAGGAAAASPASPTELRAPSQPVKRPDSAG